MFGPLPSTGRVAAWPDRRKVIAEHFPVVDLDAHRWLTDDHSLARVLRDITAVDHTEPGHRGPRCEPTPDQVHDTLSRATEAIRNGVTDP